MRLLIAFVLLLVLAAPARAAWTPSSLTSSAGRTIESVQGAIGADGTAALAWIERDLRNPPAAWVAVRPPGADFGAPIQLGLGEDVAVAAGPGGTVSVVWNGEGGLAYG